ncbi:MAG: Hpt domain-containing protein [Flavobacteriales bacterium]|nr:Hpt domain-containing protein [Flavobacteriales bacterium]
MINIEKIKEYTGADEEFIAMLFKKFLSHLDEDLEVLRSEAANENWVNVRKKTHAMLSSANIFHLEDIVALSKEIEAKVDDNDFDDLIDMTHELTTSYDNLRSEIETWLSLV